MQHSEVVVIPSWYARISAETRVVKSVRLCISLAIFVITLKKKKIFLGK